jgi:hypothetical protein
MSTSPLSLDYSNDGRALEAPLSPYQVRFVMELPLWMREDFSVRSIPFPVHLRPSLQGRSGPNEAGARCMLSRGDQRDRQRVGDQCTLWRKETR